MARTIRLAVITTHPIQYMVPWFRALSAEAEIELEVIFFREPDALEQGAGFGRAFTWDVPLREGFPSTVLGLPEGWKALGRLLLDLRRALKRIQPDVVLITGWTELGLMAAYPLVWLTRRPIIVRSDANMMRHRPRWAGTLHRLLLSMVSAVVSVGSSNRCFYLANTMPRHRVFAGCHFVDSTRMLAMSESHTADRARLRAACGFADEDVVFCFVGKHAPYKRPLLLVEAAARLIARGLPVKLLFAGSGGLTAELEQSARRNGVPAHFVGFLNQSQLWQAYIPSDVLVLPSTEHETWGLVVNEAMLFGLPVIVSDKVGCGPDLVREGETGYEFSGGADELAKAMERMIQQDHRRTWMGEQARQLVLADYSMPVATAGLKAAIAAIRSETTG